MDILDKIKKENYNKWKNNPELIQDLKNWIKDNTNINTEGLGKSEMIFLIRNGYKENPVCTCGTPIEFKYNKYRKYCSPKCSANNEKTLERRKQTVKKKYGCENVFQSDKIRKKCEETSLANWGETSYMKTKEGKEKNRKTMLDRYGVENPFQIDSIRKENAKRWRREKNKIIPRIKIGRKESHLKYIDELGKKYDFKRKFGIEDYNGCDRKNKYEFECTICKNCFNHHIDDGAIPRCPSCKPSAIARGTSIIEKNLIDGVIRICPDPIQTNDRIIIHPLELDIIIPNKKIAIELNGIYWHSENSGNKKRNYHLNKTKMCNDKGIRLIHIFEDEFAYNGKIVLNRLKYIFGNVKYKIYGRKCEVRIISNHMKNKFLNKYHIQGSDRSPIKLGAFYKNRLVAVMTFSKRRFDKKDGYELVRYATVGSFSCVGVAGKLLKYFEKCHNPCSIMSYADLRWSDGNLYTQLGFKHIHNSTPNYFYVKDGIQRLSRIAFQKHKLPSKLESFDPALSEWENMKANGYDRIWDCGNMVFEKTYD